MRRPLSMLLLAAIALLPAAAAEGPRLGEWKVTELTGSITTSHGGEAPPRGLCMNAGATGTVSAVRDSEHTYISLTFDESGTSWTVPDADRPPGMPETWSKERAERPFIFSMAFDNGYHTNDYALKDPWADGYWSQEGEVFGYVLLTQEKFGSGISKFTVAGSLDGPDRLEGDWFYEEAASAFGCTLTAKGNGSWAAVPAR